MLTGPAADMAAVIHSLLRDSAPNVVVAAGRGAGPDLTSYRRLAELYGGRFAVTRPQVEAARAHRVEMVGASSETVSPAVYLALGVSGALPHLVGMDTSGTVIAVNADPEAPIFDHADIGAVADAGQIARALTDCR